MSSTSGGSASSRYPVGVRLLIGTYAVLALGLLALGALSGRSMVGQTFPGFLTLDNGILVAFRAPSWTGGQVDLPFGGGVVESFDAQPFDRGGGLMAYAAGLEPGTVVSYRFRRGEERLDFEVPTMRLTVWDAAWTFGAYLLISAVLMGTGGIALALRYDHPAAPSLAWALGSLGALFPLGIDHMTTYRLLAPYHLLEAMAPVATLQLALVFPIERLGPGKRRTVVGGFGALMLLGALAESLWFYDQPDFAWRFDSTVYLLIGVIGSLMVVSFVEAFVRGRDALVRTRAALLLAGSLVGCVLPAVAVFSFYVLDIQLSTIFWTPFLTVYALTLLYAFARHNLLDAERMARLVVGYVVVTGAALLIYAATLTVLSRLLSRGAEQTGPASFALVLCMALGFEPARRRVQLWIDRIFYQSEVDAARILEGCSADLVSLETQQEIQARVESILEQELVVEWAQVQLDGGSPSPSPVVSEAIAFRDEHLGRIECGEKRSGAPFSSEEIELVRGLASQTALALHNARAIRELREAQAALLRVERLAAVGEFAGAVAHGIRNPLAGIRAASQSARKRAGEGPLADSLASVIAEVDRVDQRIRSLLDFSKPFQPDLRTIDLVGVLRNVERAFGPIASEQGVMIDGSSACAEVAVVGDPLLLEEAVLELVSNALRAMPGGGRVHLELRDELESCVLRVSDTGAGVPAGVRHRLFDLFFTTRPEGSGIGLPTVKKIIELHGGTVELERSDESGSVFRIELPTRSS